jgi:hypothetical protein
MIAALAPAGVPDADIIVSNRLGSSLAAVQVKSRNNVGKGGWILKAKHEKIARPLLFYAFIDFGKSLSEVPKCWLVPSTLVATVIAEDHAAWLELPGREGKPHNDSDMRSLTHDHSARLPRYGKGWLDPYYEAWHLIEEASSGSN